MSFRKAFFGLFAGVMACLSLQAQTFETRSTRYLGDEILTQLEASGNIKQLEIRDSILELCVGNLGVSDTVETFFNGYHFGLVIYRKGNPFELLGFWDPAGNMVKGGILREGSGKVKTPFNPDLIQKFKSESVVYKSGLKNGPSFYYCDCASVLRRGTFTNNKKTGLWKEFHASGEFIKEQQLEVPKPPDEIDVKKQKDYLKAAHCMMRPDLECPNPGGN